MNNINDDNELGRHAGAAKVPADSACRFEFGE